MALWIGLPVAAVAYGAVVLQDRQLIEDAPVWLSPEQSSGVQQRSAGLQLVWERPADVVAPAWTGVVQAIKIQAGDIVTSGQAVVLVDGIERLAVHSAIPFARALDSDTSGVDVAALNEVLSSMGLSASPESSKFTPRTQRGVQQLAEQLGVAEANEVKTFDPSWFIYLPDTEIAASTVALQIGAPVPAAGTTLITGRKSLASATLVDSASLPASNSSLSGSDAGEEVVASLPPFPAEEDEVLKVSTSELGLNDSKQTVEDGSLATLSGLVQEGAAFTRASLQRQIGQDELRVPAGSVISGSAGQSCVIRQVQVEEDGAIRYDARPVEVTVVGSESGSAWISGEISTNDRILLSPGTEQRSCSP